MFHFYNKPIKKIDLNYKVRFPQGERYFFYGNRKHYQPHLEGRQSLLILLDYFQIPRGQKFFLGEQRKHFESQIPQLKKQKIFSQQRVIRNYHSKLNVEDIEGAASGTAKSKLLKNRIKAQKYRKDRIQFFKLPQIKTTRKNSPCSQNKQNDQSQFCLKSYLQKQQYNKKGLEEIIGNEIKKMRWNREFIKPTSHDVYKDQWYRKWKNQNDLEKSQNQYPKWLSNLNKVNNIY